MKKQLAIAAGLAVLSTGAYASKARMQALGQGDASLYLDDTRSMFINPAKVNTTKNFVVTEWGTENATMAGTTPRLEGGMIRESGAFTYGFYFNNENANQEHYAHGNAPELASRTLDSLGEGGATGFTTAKNGLDVFFGGDMGVQWGARLHYSASTDKAASATPYDREHSAMGLGLGMMMGDIEAYANMDLTNEYTGASTKDDKWEGGAMNLGLSYAMAGWTFFADYDKHDGEYTNNDTGTAEAVDMYEMSTISVGASHVTEVSSTARIISDVRFATSTLKTDDATTGGTTVTKEAKYGRLPVQVAFEADANSWLTLRGYVGQNILINKDEFSNSNSAAAADEDTVASTMFGAGATLNFGKLKVDGMIGNGATSDQLNTDTLLSKVAVHYWF